MIETLQHPWEHTQLLDLIGTPKRVLEIGVWDGGTLQHWLGTGRTITAVDTDLREATAILLDANDSIEFIQGNSHDEAIIAAVRRAGPYDLVFIDSDHRYDAAKKDWDSYHPMVATGGAIVFHDIRRYQHGDLDRFWDEIKVGRRTVEIHDRTGPEWGGLGILWP